MMEEILRLKQKLIAFPSSFNYVRAKYILTIMVELECNSILIVSFWRRTETNLINLTYIFIVKSDGIKFKNKPMQQN